MDKRPTPIDEVLEDLDTAVAKAKGAVRRLDIALARIREISELQDALGAGNDSVQTGPDRLPFH